VAKEFNLPIEEVMNWPLSRTLEYVQFLKIWYKIQYGSMEDMEDMEDIDLSDIESQLPNISSKFKSNMPNSIKGISKIGRYGKKRPSSLHGASGHTLKFK